MPVRVVGHEANPTGVLTLGRENSKLIVNSVDFHHFDGDENGWFDLDLLDSRDNNIYFHNALSGTRSFPGAKDGKRAGTYTSEIFPNYVVLDSEHLGEDKSVRRISFQLEGLENFCVYNIFEWSGLFSASSSEKTQILNDLRIHNIQGYGGSKEKYEANDPDDIWIVHKPKLYMKFKVEGREYEIRHFRSHGSLGLTGHQMQVIPRATIRFESKVSLDDALQHVWEWISFFEQVACKRLQLKSLQASKYLNSYKEADIYLSDSSENDKRPVIDLHPLYVPYSRWKDRRRSAAAMKTWLGKYDERRFFRNATRLVISRLDIERDPTLITLLCAAIESLPELRGSNSLCKTTLQKMAKAAHAEQTAYKLEDIKNLLGNLGGTSLKKMVANLLKKMTLLPEGLDRDDFVKICGDLRNDVAHGRLSDEEQISTAGSFTEVLLGICVCYDLQTSGCAGKNGEHRLIPLVRAGLMLLDCRARTKG